MKKNIIAILTVAGMLLTGCSSNKYDGIKYNLKEDKYSVTIKSTALYSSLYEDNNKIIGFLVEDDLLPENPSQVWISDELNNMISISVQKGTVNEEIVFRVLNRELHKRTSNENDLNTCYKVVNGNVEKIPMETIELHGFDGNDDGKYDDEFDDIPPKGDDIVIKEEVAVEEKEEVKTGFSIKHGELLNETITGDILVIKAKIKPSYSNKTTIDQNGYNIEKIIKEQGGDKFREVQYWAVADMQSGEESKVISFTINESLISSIKNGSVVGNQIIDNADDVWILPSLQIK